MPQLQLRTRLLLLFTLPIIGLLLLAYVNISASNTLFDDFVEVSEVSLPIVTSVEEMKFASSRLISSANELILDGIIGEEDEDDEEGEEGELAEVEEAIADYNASFSIYSGLVETDEHHGEVDQQLVSEVEAAGQELLGIVDNILELIESEADLDELTEQRELLEDAESDLLLVIENVLEEERLHLIEDTQEVEARSTNFNTITRTVVITTLIVIAGISAYLFYSIFRPLNELTETASKLREGDLSARSHIHSHDELGQFANTFNAMVDNLQARQNELVAARDEALAARKLADESARLKSEFLSTMSHELRTPLNAIEGFTSIMLGGMGIELSPRAEDMVGRVSSNSKRLLRLINDFLDLSRIEADRLELVKNPVSMEALVSRWENEVSVLASEKGIDFNVMISSDFPDPIYIDEDALSKITINLLSNAFKFTHEGTVSLSIQESNHHMKIDVSDTGIGIPIHARDYIFDEFRQVDGSSKRLYGGTGLGLALVQKLSRAMGGTVAVQSEMGEGSTFTVMLPLITEQQAVGAN